MRVRRRNVVLTVAICASLLMHGLVFDAIVVKETQELAARIPQPPIDGKLLVKPDLEVEDLFGEHGGLGKGLNSSPGAIPMETRQADQDQAALTPRPGSPAAGGNGGQQARKAVEAMATTSSPMSAPLIPTPPPVASSAFKIQPATKPTVAAKAQPTQVASASGGTPGHGSAGEVGHKSESESDAFSDHPPLIFHDGKVEAREGMEVRTVKPKFTPGGEDKLAMMDDPTIIIKVKVNEQGDVTDADYLRRSNLAEVDLPHLRAAYEWHFSPARDKFGKPHRDSQIIVFQWR